MVVIFSKGMWVQCHAQNCRILERYQQEQPICFFPDSTHLDCSIAIEEQNKVDAAQQART